MSTVSGDASHAMSALDGVIATAEQQSLHLEAMWTRLDLGAVLATVDRPRAAMSCGPLAPQPSSHGAITEGRLADQQLRALGVRTWRRTTTTAGDGGLASLTNREREIAQLVAGGASDVRDRGGSVPVPQDGGALCFQHLRQGWGSQPR